MNGFANRHPEGMTENSPMLQHWGGPRSWTPVPNGTAEPWLHLSAVPSELPSVRPINPKLKHWAIIRSPFGRRTLHRQFVTNFAGVACRLRTFLITGVGLLLTWAFYSSAAPAMDPTKLPPPAQAPVDFDRDVKPIFQQTCFRCHGPERPKSHFRLDNRESALKGGDNGIDIVPGDSSKSPLIFYVARLVEDMEMPPPGKGEPLSPEQVGLFRAWIDQGANWGATNPPAQLAFSAEPALRWITVSGDKSKFREIEGVKEGFGGGVQHFAMEEQIGVDKKISVEGHALFPENDIQIKLALEKSDLGFVHAGFEQWRRYYDDTGGYYRPFSVPSFDLNRDLHLDIGRAWFDFGLTLPQWPQMVFGYEYQFRNGDESTLEWGMVTNRGDARNIYPGAKNIDEQTHIIKFDLTHEIGGWRIEDNARVELYDLKTREDNVVSYTIGSGIDSQVQTRESNTHVQGMNTLHLERQLKDWWLLSGGYLYSRLDGDSSLNQVTTGTLTPQSTFWSTEPISLRRQSHIISAGSLFRPIDGLNASVGVQSEWTRQEGMGHIHLDEGDATLMGPYTLYPAIVQSDLDETKVSETVSVRFTRIPWTVLFVDARFEQDSIGQFENDQADLGAAQLNDISFRRDTDYTNDRREYRAGFDTSPWRWFSLSAHYKRRISDSDYDTTKAPLTLAGYSGFIRAREIDGDEAQTKLVLRPATWLKTTLTYQWVNTDYHTTTDPGPGGIVPDGLLAGNYYAHVYGFNATLTPFQRVYFSGSFTYSDSRTKTAAIGSPSVAPYKGNIYTVLASATYILSSKADLSLTYAFSRSDYGQNNLVDGLPLGLDYTRHALMAGTTWHLSKTITTSLRYGFYQYSEPTSGGLNDYTAHAIFASLAMKLK